MNQDDNGWLDDPAPPESESQARNLKLAVLDNDLLQAELVAAGAIAKFGFKATGLVPSLEAEHFRDINLRHIVAAAMAIIEREDLGYDDPHCFVDLVQAELDRENLLAAVGGPPFVVELWLHQAPSVPDVMPHWSERIIEAWRTRELVQRLGAAQHSIGEGEDTRETMTGLWRACKEIMTA